MRAYHQLAAVGAIGVLVAGCRLGAPPTAPLPDAPPAATAAPALPPGLAATVVEVVDGDTVVVRVGRTTETVRLIGVDTPETVKPDHPVECFGPEASAWLRSLLPAGSPVTLLGDDERRDVYGRMLAYVLSANPAVAAHSGLVNLAIVAGGYGRALVIAPNDAFASHFRSAAAWARDRGLGLWGACPPQPAVSR